MAGRKRSFREDARAIPRTLLLRWSDRSKRDLQRIHDFLAKESVDAADAWLRRLLKGAERLADLPLSGRVVPEYETPDVREVIIGPYRIVYRVSSTDVAVVFVIHGSRVLPRTPGKKREPFH